MSDLVPPEDIERIVGTPRHETMHYGRATDRMVYILHSHECKLSGIDLRECCFSIALDRGIREQSWADYQDVPVALGILLGRLVPVAGTEIRLAETTLDALRDQVAASIRAELLILAYTPNVTTEVIVSAGIRDAKKWVERGLEKFREADSEDGRGL